MTAEERRAAKVTGMVAGAVLMLARFVVPQVWQSNGISLGDANGLCHSALGAIAKAMDHQAVTSCSEISYIMLGLTGAAVAGVALAAWCGFRLYRGQR